MTELPYTQCASEEPVSGKRCTLAFNHAVHRNGANAWATEHDALRAELERLRVARGASRALARYRLRVIERQRQRVEQAEATIAAKDDENGLLQAHYRAAGRVIAEQRAALARVWGLHARVNTAYGKACDHCRGRDEEHIPWPCPTIAALAQPDQEGTI